MTKGGSIVIDFIGNEAPLIASLNALQSKVKPITVQLSMQGATGALSEVTRLTSGISTLIAEVKALDGVSASSFGRITGVVGSSNASLVTMNTELNNAVVTIGKLTAAWQANGRAAQQAQAVPNANLRGMIGASGGIRGAGGMNNIALASSFINPQLGMAATAVTSLGATGAVLVAGAALVKITKDGQDEVKKLQQAYLNLEVNGVKNIKGVDDALNHMIETGSTSDKMFSKGELAGALAQLSRSGFKGAEGIAALSSATRLAASEHISLSEATKNLAANLQHLEMTGEEAATFGDKLVRASHLTQDSANDFSKGMNVIGFTAQKLGFSLDETMGMLVALSKKGLDPATIGSTGLRNAMQMIEHPSKNAAAAMAALGVATVDSAGHARTGRDIFTELMNAVSASGNVYSKTTGKLMSENDRAAINFQIFGTRSATAFIGVQHGAAEAADQISKSAGFLTESSDHMATSLEASQKRLKVSFTNLSREFAETFTPAIAGTTDALTGLVSWMGNLGTKANEVKPYLEGLGIVLTALTIKTIASTTVMKELMLAQALGGMANVATVAATAIKLKLIPAIDGATAATTAFMALNPVTLFALAAGGLGLYVNSILDNIHKIQDEVAKTESDVTAQQEKLWGKGKLGQLETQRLQLVQGDTAGMTPAAIKHRQDDIALLGREIDALKNLGQASGGATNSVDTLLGVGGRKILNEFNVSGANYHHDGFANPNAVHHGVDFAAPRGTPIYAPFAGDITARRDAKNGNIFELADAAGNKLVGLHLDQFTAELKAALAKGGGKALIMKGAQIGTVGNTGAYAGATPHLHLEGWLPDGTKVDPRTIPYGGVPLAGGPAGTPVKVSTKAPPEMDPNFKPPPVAPLKALQTEFTALRTAYAAGKMDIDAYHGALEALRSKAEQLATTQKTGSKEWTATETLIRSASTALKAHAKATDDLTPITAAQIAQAQRLEAALKKAQDAHDPKATDAATSAIKRFSEASFSNARAIQSVNSTTGKAAASGSYIASLSDLKKYGDDALKLIKQQEAAQQSGDAARAASADAALAAFTKDSKARASVVQIEQAAYSARKSTEQQTTADQVKLAEGAAQAKINAAQGSLEKLKQIQSDELANADTAAQRMAVIQKTSTAIYKGELAVAEEARKKAYAAADKEMNPALRLQARATADADYERAKAAAAREQTQAINAARKSEDAETEQRRKTATASQLAADQALADGRSALAKSSAQRVLTAYDTEVQKAGSSASAKLLVEQAWQERRVKAMNTISRAEAQAEVTNLEQQRNRLMGAEGVTKTQRQALWVQYADRIKAVDAGLTATLQGNQQTVTTSVKNAQAEQLRIVQENAAKVAASLSEVLANPDQYSDGAKGQKGPLVSLKIATADILDLLPTTASQVDSFRSALDDLAQQGKITADQLALISPILDDIKNNSLVLQPLLPDNLEGRGIPANTVPNVANDPAYGAVAQDQIAGLQEALLTQSSEWLAKEYGDLFARGLQGSDLGKLLATEMQNRIAPDNTLRDVLTSPNDYRDGGHGIDPSIKLDASEIHDAYLNVDEVIKNIGTMAPDVFDALIRGSTLSADDAEKLSEAYHKAQLDLTDFYKNAEEYADGSRGLKARPAGATTEEQSAEFGRLASSLQDMRASMSDPAQVQAFQEAITEIGRQGGISAVQVQNLLAMIDNFSQAAVDGPLSHAEQTFESTASSIDGLVASYQEGGISALDFGKQVTDLIPKLEALAKAAEANGNADLAEYYRAAVTALKAMTPEVTKLLGTLDRVSEYAGYVRDLSGALSNLSGDLGANMQGLSNVAGKTVSLISDVGRILANPADIGAWVSAITNIASSVADAIAGFQKAKEQVKQLKEDFQSQFSFVNGADFAKTFTRSRGFFADVFGGGPEVVQEIDKVGVVFAKTMDTAFGTGIKDGLKTALMQNDFSLFGQTLKEQVFGGVVDGITEAFKSDVLTATIAPAIKAWAAALKTPGTADDAAALEGIKAAVGTAEQLGQAYYTQVQPLISGLQSDFGLDNTGKAAGSGNPSIIGAGPAQVWGVPEIKLPDSFLTAWSASIGYFGGHIDRFGGFVSRLEALEGRSLIVSRDGTGGLG